MVGMPRSNKKLFETAYMSVVAGLKGEPEQIHLVFRKFLLKIREMASEIVPPGQICFEDVPVEELALTELPSVATGAADLDAGCGQPGTDAAAAHLPPTGRADVVEGA